MVPQTVIHDAVARRWLAFANPIEIIRTDHPQAVKALMRRVIQRVETQGLWAAGFLSYEAAPAFDPALTVRLGTRFPLLWFGIFKEPEEMEELGNAPQSDPPALTWHPALARSEYDQAIARIKQHISRGDTYQVNYTIRMLAQAAADFPSWPYFLSLIREQQSEYCAYIEGGDFAVCSASPELFFRLDGDKLTSRPMKGTVRRGRTTAEDRSLSEWLSSSEKNRAENVMIVDMMRNDFGRVARIGSVTVPELFKLERYPTLWQMTSQVTAMTETPLLDIVSATFPAASVTGAPKPRTMQIIADLETAPRRVYTGAIGFIAPGRQAQFNVAIRTVLFDRARQQAEYGVGGGIVWDSGTNEEYEECLAKARVLSHRPRDFELLETILWTPEGGFALLDSHLERLQDSADYFEFGISLDKIRTELKSSALNFKSKQRIRLLVNKSGVVTIQSFPFEDSATSAPVKLRLAAQPVNSQDLFLFHKTTNRAIYDAARSQVRDCDDVIFWNEEGQVTETTIDNIVVRLSEDDYVTPPVDCGLLAGTYRRELLKQGRIREQVISVAELKRAPGIAVINSVRGWREAVLIS